MSSDVAWQVLRTGHSFLVKRDGFVLSREPGNLLNVHSYKFSGLANNKLVHVAAGKDKKPHLTILKSDTAYTHSLACTVAIGRCDASCSEWSSERGESRGEAAVPVVVQQRAVRAGQALTFLRSPSASAVLVLLPCRARTARDHMKRTVTPLLKHRRDRAIRAAHVINSATALSHHRPDLTKFAIARYHALHRASLVKDGSGVNVKRRRTPAKERRAKKSSTA